jgi:hypothetical protein
MKAILPLAVLGILVMLPGVSQAQTNSNIATVTLTAGVAPYVSVSVNVASVNFTLVPGTGPTAGSNPVIVTTNWGLAGPANMALWGSFANSASALTNGTDNITTARVSADVNGVAAGAFTATGPFGGASAGKQVYSGAVAAVGNRNDTLDLYIDLTGLTTLSSGTYTGTLSLQAQAI